MLSDEAKSELRALARSELLRQEFDLLRAMSRRSPNEPVDVDQLLAFLTTMSRLSVVPPAPRPFVPYTNVRL